MSQALEQFSDATVYLGLAVVGTLLFVIRLGLMMLGLHHDVGHDIGGHLSHADPHHADSDASFTLFSVQSVLAFFMGAGWIGLAARIEWHWDAGSTALVATAFGFVMMVLAATLSYYTLMLNKEGRYDLKTCVGTTGRVYLQIPAHGEGTGQVEVDVSGQRKIIPASTRGGAIASFAVVTVVGIEDGNRVVVEPHA